jgi:glycerol-1-phosphate dehydrogenase [NAD(P)+]
VSGKLRSHLLSFGSARDMLRAAGCPYEPEQIGISRRRLKGSYELARLIRRRYTVLDFAERAGMGQTALDRIFGQTGNWPIREEKKWNT